MQQIPKKVSKILISSIAYVLAVIYDFIFSNFLTSYCHQQFVKHLKQSPNQKLKKLKHLLDVGIATGKPLYSVIHEFNPKTEIMAIDINQKYIQIAQERFNKIHNVTIAYQDFFNMAQNPKNLRKFDAILFSFSFMLLPDQQQFNQEKALQIAKQLLSPEGRIYLILTVHLNEYCLVTRMKPVLKYFTTIDFGKITVKHQFLKFLSKNGIKIEDNFKIYKRFNIPMNVFNIEFYELSAI